MKNSTSFWKPKNFAFYWNENLNPLWCQLLKKFWKIFFESEVMGNIFSVVLAKNTCFLPTFGLKMLVITDDPRKILKNFFDN